MLLQCFHKVRQRLEALLRLTPPWARHPSAIPAYQRTKKNEDWGPIRPYSEVR